MKKSLLFTRRHLTVAYVAAILFGVLFSGNAFGQIEPLMAGQNPINIAQASEHSPTRNCPYPSVQNFGCSFTAPLDVTLEWDHPLPGEVIRWDSGLNNTGIGLEDGGTFLHSVRFEPVHLQPHVGHYLTSVYFFPLDNTAAFTLNIWSGEDGNNLIFSQNVQNIVEETWNEVSLDAPLQIAADETLYIGFEVTHAAGFYPAGCDSGPAVAGYGDLIFMDGGWVSMTQFGLDYNWNIAGLIEEQVTTKIVDREITHAENNFSKNESSLADGKVLKAIPTFTENNRFPIIAQLNVYKNGDLLAVLPPDATSYVDELTEPGIAAYSIGVDWVECESLSDECTPDPYVAQPQIFVDPDELHFSLPPNYILEGDFLISNVGEENSVLDFEIDITYIITNGSEGSEEDNWLQVEPPTGSVDQGDTQSIGITITTTDNMALDYLAHINIYSNAQNEPFYVVTVMLDVWTGIDEINPATFSMYPNPAQDFITIAGNDEAAVCRIFDMLGKEILVKEGTLPMQVNLEDLGSGIYFVNVETNTSNAFQKLILNR